MRRSIRRLILLGLVACSCAVNPVTGKRELALLTESQEISLGREADPQIVAEYGLYEDPKIQAYVNEVGQKMARLSHRPNLEFTFRVLDSPILNAFALPGGYIYITRGILAHMNNEAELAMVVGHEIGHVTARHGVSQQSRAQVASLGLGLGSVFSETVARYGQVAQQATGMLFLKYGRDDERQSDELGVEYSLKAGYDAAAGCKFFEVLDRQSAESGQSLPNWMSTHPAPAERVSTTRQLAATRKPQFPGATAVAEDRHKRLLEGMVFGDDPRQGFFEDGIFKHPALRFQVVMPRGWRTANTPNALQALESQERALLQLTLAPGQGVTPAQHTARVAQGAQATIAQARAERIHGAEAYLATLVVAAQDAGQVPVFFGAVQRQAGGSIYQFVGQAAAGAYDGFVDEFTVTVRSLDTLTDPKALNVEPDRVAVLSITAPTTVSRAAANAPVPAATIALLNNLAPDAPLARGFQLKTVRRK